jgi:hypothetical protein
VDTKHGKCEVCGQKSMFDVHVYSDGETATKSYCLDHAPAEFRERMLNEMPFGPHRTPAEEVAFLRQQIAAIEQQVSNLTDRAEYIAEVEQVIADIEAGRRRLGYEDETSRE